MKDPRTAGRAASAVRVPPSIEQLRAAAIGRAVGLLRSDQAQARLVAHADALGAGRPTVSPAAARSVRATTRKPGSTSSSPG